ncbi:uncharacterized protein LOC127848219 [Dreissena polymorpha]|uniref:uncharacterized protein LOC127848219 n=1 Tax=Dreissena polymorpha TaxID=45954 RepID=UPI0022642492|nr:uncharacterized protein LOC127848219 [Dreissena polymorpha]XP_052236502.1 uncharacterized protein LOC127848219 [Dreissena polymorpha]XP_052236503.1 uncharacterized protein LOC127848219 [Dreissena polymorpha]XP_052236504.1 uncharacterized protein LOC127848219 [Dreissena polymorpha]
MASNGTMSTNGREMQKMFQTIAAIELYHAQREVANYLELAYLNLADHPDAAKEVRMTAHSARSQHLMTSGLMKKFTVTAGHIVNTMVPMILDAVELQDRDIIIDVFGQIIENAEAMKKESEDTRTSYLKLQTEIQKNMAFVNDKNKHVIKESERLKVQMEREKQMAKAAALAQKELEEEKKRMQDDLALLKGQRDQMFKNAEGAGRDMSVEDDTTFLDAGIRPSAIMGGGVGIALEFVGKAVNFFTSMFKGDKKKDRYKELMKGYQAAEENVHRAQKERRDVVERVNEQRKEAHQRLAKMKELSIQQSGLGNVESLREASLHLGDVDRQFTRIIQFWENMAAILKYLKEDVRAGEVYLKKIENEKYAERFKKSISRAEKDWQFFGKICSDYVQESDTELRALYNFLSSPIDHMSKSDRTTRKKALISSIEADIDSAYGEDN